MTRSKSGEREEEWKSGRMVVKRVESGEWKRVEDEDEHDGRTARSRLECRWVGGPFWLGLAGLFRVCRIPRARGYSGTIVCGGCNIHSPSQKKRWDYACASTEAFAGLTQAEDEVRVLLLVAC